MNMATAVKRPHGGFGGDHAIVVGAGTTGRVATAVAARHFDRVTNIDRDRLPHDRELDVMFDEDDDDCADFNAAVGVSLSDPACTATVTDPDQAAAQEAVEQELNGGSMEDIFNEMRVGIHFADTVTMSCAPPSN